MAECSAKWWEVLKEKGKANQDGGSEASRRTVRVLIRAMRERIEANVCSVKRWLEKLIRYRVVMEGKFIGRGRHNKLRQLVRRLSEKEYGRKWRDELEDKGRHLTLQYGKIKVADDKVIIAGVT